MSEEDENTGFEEMMDEVQEEIQENYAEDEVVSRAPELRQLSKDIDKATNTWINATLQLESVIHKYNAAQATLSNTVGTISGKVDTINTHIDGVLKDAPTKLKVSVGVTDEDWKKITDMIGKEHKWIMARCRAISVSSTIRLLMNAREFSEGTRNMIAPISDIISSPSFGFSAS